MIIAVHIPGAPLFMFFLYVRYISIHCGLYSMCTSIIVVNMPGEPRLILTSIHYGLYVMCGAYARCTSIHSDAHLCIVIYKT